MPKARILIAEDEAIVAEDLFRKLGHLGYKICGVTASGEEAVALARERRPDLVLMDIRLQGPMDGIEAAQIIRQECSIAVIYLTAHADSATLQRAKLTEPFGYILKPFEEPDLEAHIQVALYKHQAEQDVRRQREWLQVTVQSIGDGVITTDAAGKITSLNPVAQELTGWKVAEAQGRPLAEVFNIINEESRKPGPNPVERVLREGKVVALANHTTLISRDGQERPIDDSAAPIKDEQGRTLGVVMVFHDVTERRRAEAALRESERQYRSLFEHMLGGFAYCRMLYDNASPRDFIYLNVNQAFERLTGLKDVVGKKVSEVIPGVHQSNPELLRIYGRAAQTGEPARFETYLEPLGVWFAVSVYSPQKDHFVAVFDNITERKQKEIELQKLNRTLKALGQSNAAMVRATSEQELLQAVCKIVAEDCGHAMVWIGFREEDEAKSVRPVAHAGFEEGYLETLQVTWADTERGRGPTGTAIRTGKPCQCQDMRTDPAFMPWREQGLRRGYRSSLVLPLLADGVAFGAVSIYSRQPAAFSTDEVRLLTELANDLSFGITTMRLRAAHARTDVLLRTVLESSPDPIFLKDRHSRILLANQATCMAMGKPAARIIGMTDLEVYDDPAVGRAMIENDRRVMESGQSQVIEEMLPGPDGPRTFLSTKAPYRDAEGKIIGTIGVARDITDRKRIEQALRDSNDKLALALRSAGMGAWRLDLPQSKRHFDDQVCRCLGIDPLRFAGTAEEFHAAVHPADQGRLKDALAQTIATGAPYEVEYRAVWPDQSVHYIAARAQLARDATGQPQRLDGLVWDITERKRAEEALRRAEAQLAQGVRVARLGIFEHDHGSDVIEYSPIMRELLGFAPDEEVTIAATVHKAAPEDREALATAIRRAHDPAGNGLFEVEYRVPNPDGGTRWISKRAQTFFEGDGSDRHPVRTIGAALDVTERKEIQSRLERLVAERTSKLQELVGELEHFSYSITHDMRAPLRGMQGFAELMAESCAGCPEVEAVGFLRRIRTSAGRMDSLITDALNYSKAVRQELVLAPVDAGALLRGMLDSYPELQPSRAHIEIHGEIPRVMGNEAGLTQCFSNLLGNAIKFVKPGQKPEICIRAERLQGWVRIWVEDNGIGIPEPMLPRVFDMFSRGHQSYEGTGIGLALVRKVTARMGGNVGVESQEGQGSRFWLDLKPGDVRSGR